jgi:hypothetical protein
LGKTCNAIEYYDTEITKLDQLASEEYDRIVETRLKWRYSSVLANESEDIRHSCQFGAHRLYSLFVPSDAHKFFGEVPNNFFHGTGIVTFKSIASKQSGKFMNISVWLNSCSLSNVHFKQLYNVIYPVSRTG